MQLLRLTITLPTHSEKYTY